MVTGRLDDGDSAAVPYGGVFAHPPRRKEPPGASHEEMEDPGARIPGFRPECLFPNRDLAPAEKRQPAFAQGVGHFLPADETLVFAGRKEDEAHGEAAATGWVYLKSDYVPRTVTEMLRVFETMRGEFTSRLPAAR